MSFIVSLLLTTALVYVSAQEKFKFKRPINPIASKIGFYTSAERSISVKTEKSQSHPTYLLGTVYPSGQSCGGEAEVVFAHAFGACIVGETYNPYTNVTLEDVSMMTIFLSQDNGSISFMQYEYNTTDCSGYSVQTRSAVPNSCIPADDDSDLRYSVSTSATPYDGYKGVVDK